MNLPNCPHCRTKLGQYAYATTCPHCRKELVHNRRATLGPDESPPSPQRYAAAAATLGIVIAIAVAGMSNPAPGWPKALLWIVASAVVGAVLGAAVAWQSARQAIEKKRQLKLFYAGFDLEH